jgi:hypothetical protein
MSTHQTESIGSVVIGFVLAVTNHFFGWLNHVFLDFHVQAWGESIQAIVTGILGATGAYFTTKFWKAVEKKIKKIFTKE